MLANEINFDDKEALARRSEEMVEISVGALRHLLGCYYTGGGQPDSLNARLELATNYKDFL
jgi:hypothetical protein